LGERIYSTSPKKVEYKSLGKTLQRGQPPSLCPRWGARIQRGRQGAEGRAGKEDARIISILMVI
jgi:hypothetical protein